MAADVSSAAVTLAQALSKVRALTYFEKDVIKCRALAITMGAEMTNVRDVLATGFKVPGVKYFGSGRVYNINYYLEEIITQIRSILTRIPSDLEEAKTELRRGLAGYYDSVVQHNESAAASDGLIKPIRYYDNSDVKEAENLLMTQEEKDYNDAMVW